MLEVREVKMNDGLLSQCCDAPARYGVYHNGYKHTGICSKCGEHADFFKEDEEEEENDDDWYTNEMWPYL